MGADRTAFFPIASDRTAFLPIASDRMAANYLPLGPKAIVVVILIRH